MDLNKKLDVISNKIDLDDELFKPNIYEELSTINYSLDEEYKTLFKEEVWLTKNCNNCFLT